MTTKSTTVNVPSTLLEEWVERIQMSWLQVTVVVGLGLILFLVGTTFLAGVLTEPFDASFWRAGLLYPAIIIYILSTLATLKRLRDGAIRSFHQRTHTTPACAANLSGVGPGTAFIV